MSSEHADQSGSSPPEVTVEALNKQLAKNAKTLKDLHDADASKGRIAPMAVVGIVVAVFLALSITWFVTVTGVRQLTPSPRELSIVIDVGSECSTGATCPVPMRGEFRGDSDDVSRELQHFMEAYRTVPPIAQSSP